MRITRLEPDRRDPERTRVFVDGVERCSLATELVLSSSLRVGEPVSEAALDALLGDDEPFRARAAALSLLAVRQRSRAELRRRLRAKGFGAAVVEACLERLESLRLVDDAAFAGAFARDRIRFRPQGAQRTVRELRGRGVDEDTALEAVREARTEEGAGEADLARQAAAKWRRRAGEAPESARRRLYGFLARRGFDPEVVREVVEEVLSDG
jgi:regulatory protein